MSTKKYNFIAKNYGSKSPKMNYNSLFFLSKKWILINFEVGNLHPYWIIRDYFSSEINYNQSNSIRARYGLFFAVFISQIHNQQKESPNL